MMKNYAHRGFSGQFPENTMLAFEKAVEAGCDGIEFDVQMTADGKLVVIHDETLERTTDGEGLVARQPLARLRQYNAAARFAGMAAQPIPTLRECLALVQRTPGFVANIELKTGVFEYEGIEEKTLQIIDELGLRGRVILSSFNHFSVLRFGALAPGVKLAFLTESWFIGMGAYTAGHGVQCVHPLHNSLTAETFGEMQRHGREVNAWTVNDGEDVRRMLALGVSGVIGNHPDRAARIIKEMGR